MFRSVFALPLAAIVWSAPAVAGEEPLYAETPEWVEQADVAALIAEDGPADILADRQFRLEQGMVVEYTDTVIRIDNPTSLMAQNTQSLTWLPDKGDLTIHRFEIHREGEVIDLVEDGVRFEVLRREQGLEYRLLDGQLTATVSVPGLREGDVLRIAHSVTLSDQALGDEVQAAEWLRSEPWQVGTARLLVSWPADAEMYWDVEDRVTLAEPELRDGYRWLSVDLPLEEADPVPRDAPYRFRRPPVLRVGSFASWEELSAIMTPHFEAAAQLTADSPVAAEAARIMAQTEDLRERAALATQLVQDEVSYLLDGLDGGNYLPQSAEETWDIRYGDCKAKSVLLLSLLREMGIEAETVLVHSRAGDAVPELLPLPGAFDHMIVRAEIDGVVYWLDGTSSATRVANLADVPPFHYALPLREGGVGLVEMEQRELAQPQMAMRMTMDQSAGADWPALMSTSMTMTGPAAAQMQAMVDADNPDQLRMLARSMGSGQEMVVSDITLAYDEETATGSFTFSGLAPSSFQWRDGRLRAEMDTPSPPSFNPDRSRPSWRDIPVATSGPSRALIETVLVLPQQGEGFSLDGPAEISADFANMRFSGGMGIEGGVLTGTIEVFESLGEVPAEDVPALKREARRFDSVQTEIVPPENVVWRWELTEAERAERAEPILARLEDAIAFADEDDYTPRRYRIWFLERIFDYENVLPDLDFLIEETGSPSLYSQRALIHQSLGNIDAAIADRQTAYDLDPSHGYGRTLADLLALNGDVEAGLAIMNELPVAEADEPNHAYYMGVLLAMSGDVAGGEALMTEMVEDNLQDSAALNLDCWFRGLFELRLETAVERCTQAIERADNSASELDSRALVHFRRGDYDAAIADLDAALLIAPELAAARYLRGIVRLHAGDEGGAADVRHGLLMAPYLAEEYAQYGIAPPE